MCGIYGIWDRSRKPVSLAAVQTATNRLRHRGPDDEGYWLCSPERNLSRACGGPDSDPRLALPGILEFAAEPWPPRAVHTSKK